MSESGHHIPTLSDVAHAAGVSKTTASRVLNGSPRVADATRARVLTAIDELGFTASSSARSLALGKSHAVGIVATEPLDDLLIDPTYGMLLRGISERASALDHVTMLFQAARTAEVAMVMRAVSRGIIDGLIHISPHHDAGLLDRLAASAIPVSLCGKPPSTQAPPRFSAVYSDDVIGARRAALHLVSRGVRRPAIILGPMSDSASADRLIGYREALGELFDAQLVRTGGWGAAAGRQAATALLTSEPEIDAFLCASDRIARGVLAVLHEHDVAIPSQVKVIGFDDHHFARELEPPLTTVAQPFSTQGARAVDLLVATISGKQPTVERLESTLIVRDST